MKSKTIEDASYENGVITVKFKSGGTYYYQGSEDLFREWEATFDAEESTGRFFHKHIKPLPRVQQ
jgi:hypothetical protein